MILVLPANIQDRDGAKDLLKRAKNSFSRLCLIWADGGYSGKLVDWVLEHCDWVLEIVKRSDDVKGFQVLPRTPAPACGGWGARGTAICFLP